MIDEAHPQPTRVALDLPARLREVIALDSAAPALRFEGRWHSWADLDRVRGSIDEVLTEVGLPAGTPVDVLAGGRRRSRPTSRRSERCSATRNSRPERRQR